MYRLLLPALLICANLAAQQYPFDYYTPKEGLVNARIRQIKQDSKGLMYFMTYGGLSIYDGNRFRNFTQSEGLGVDFVNDLLEITPDTILIATNTNRLNMLVNGELQEYPTADGICPTINRMIKTTAGDIYVAADDGMYILKERKFTRLNTKYGNTDVGDFGELLLQWNDNLIMIPWNVALGISAVVYNIKHDRVTDVVKNSVIYSFANDQKGRLWMTSNKGISVLDANALKNGKIVEDPNAQIDDSIRHMKQSAIQFDKFNNIWLSNSKTLLKMKPGGEVEHIQFLDATRASGISSLFIDRSNVLWIGTDGNGVVKLKNQNIQLYNIIHRKKISITALTEKNDTVWMYDNLNNTVIRFTPSGTTEYKFGKKFVVTQLVVSGPSLLLSSGFGVLVVKDKNDPRSYDRPGVFFDHGQYIGSGLIDQYGSFLTPIAKSDTAFVIARIINGDVAESEPIPYTFEYPIFDRQGKLWVITRNNKVLSYSLDPKNKNYFKLHKDYSSSCPPLNSRSMTFDQNGLLWIGTRYKGLYGFRVHKDSLEILYHFSTKDGLSDNFVSALACDDNNTLWVGTQSGLDRVYKRDGHYTIGNLSKNNGFFQMISKIAVTDEVWAVTTEGAVMRVRSQVQDSSMKPPTVLLRSLLVNNVPAEVRSDLNHKENNLSFTVATPYYADEKSIRYSYRLEGSGNDSWSAPGATPTFNFVNLSPGKYKLHLKAEFPEQLFLPIEFQHAFTIHPPWWNTWGFRIPMFIVFIFGCVYVIRKYFERKMERQMLEMEKLQAIEKERTRIASDMHDDLGAGLSRIKFLSETIGMKKQQHQPIEEDITKIREYSHEMIDKMGEIVWALNERNDSISDLVSYTRSYTVEYLSQNGIECSIQLPESIPLGFVSGEFRRNIFLTVKEALHNIVKHSQARRVKMIMDVNKYLEIKLHDDGVGIHIKTNGRAGNGLLNMQRRIKDIGGELVFKNSNGTLVELRVPLPV